MIWMEGKATALSQTKKQQTENAFNEKISVNQSKFASEINIIRGTNIEHDTSSDAATKKISFR